MNIKYNIDKEKGKLVAVQPEKPAVGEFIIALHGDVQAKEALLQKVAEYEAHIAQLPPPIQISPDFLAYSETKPGPYERNIHFEVIEECVRLGEYCTDQFCDERAPIAYPIQKAEPAESAPLNDRQEWAEQEMWDTIIGVAMSNFSYQEKLDRFIPYFKIIDRRKLTIPAEPAPLPDNWNEWVKDEAGRVYREAWIEISPGHHKDINFAWREVWKSGATSVLNKLLPELERLKAENKEFKEPQLKTGTQQQFGKELMQWMLPDDVRITELKNQLQEKDKEISRLKGLLRGQFTNNAFYDAVQRGESSASASEVANDEWNNFCQQHNIEPNQEQDKATGNEQETGLSK